MVVGAEVVEDELEEVEVRSLLVEGGLLVVEGLVVDSLEVVLLLVGTEVVVTVGDGSVVVLEPDEPVVVGSFCEVEDSVGGA